MTEHIEVDGVFRKANKQWIGVEGTWREIKKKWVGVGGAWREFFTNGVTLNPEGAIRYQKLIAENASTRFPICEQQNGANGLPEKYTVLSSAYYYGIDCMLYAVDIKDPSQIIKTVNVGNKYYKIFNAWPHPNGYEVYAHRYYYDGNSQNRQTHDIILVDFSAGTFRRIHLLFDNKEEMPIGTFARDATTEDLYFIAMSGVIGAVIDIWKLTGDTVVKTGTYTDFGKDQGVAYTRWATINNGVVIFTYAGGFKKVGTSATGIFNVDGTSYLQLASRGASVSFHGGITKGDHCYIAITTGQRLKIRKYNWKTKTHVKDMDTGIVALANSGLHNASLGAFSYSLASWNSQVAGIAVATSSSRADIYYWDFSNIENDVLSFTKTNTGITWQLSWNGTSGEASGTFGNMMTLMFVSGQVTGDGTFHITYKSAE